MSKRFERPNERNRAAGRTDGASSMMQLFGQMMILPLSVFVYGLELFVRTVRGMQGVADDGMDVVVGGTARTRTGIPTVESRFTNGETVNEGAQSPDFAQDNLSNNANRATTSQTDSTVGDVVETNQKERRTMDDKNLSDDMLKLVRYKILFVKRDYEVAFPEREELVYDNMTDTAYTAWKIAQFIQELDQTEVPAQWGGGRNEDRVPKYPPPVRDRDGRLLTPRWGARRGAWVIRSLPEDDKKYLRVYFQVLDRYVREDLQYEQQQLDALEDIAKAIREKDRHRGGVVSTERADEGTYTEGAD